MPKKRIIRELKLKLKKDIFEKPFTAAMKKYLFFLPALLFCSINMYGQSVKFSDLVYYTNLTNGEVHNTLLEGSAFKQDYTEDVNGQQLEFFKNINSKRNSEKIIVGRYTKLYDGTVLRTVNYTSTDPQNIINMISQAKRNGLDMKFRGADASNSIYLFDNNLYHVSIYIRHDQTSGLVEIKQKEFLGLE